MSRNVCVTAVEGHTGFLIAELLLKKQNPFARKVDSVTGLALDPNAPRAKELTSLGAKIFHHIPGRESQVVRLLKNTSCNALCLVPPAHREKMDISTELVRAAKKAGIPNVLLISSVGCDYADPKKQPRLREFIELEVLHLAMKGDPSTDAGQSPCVIRAGFYAENLLIYAPQAQEEGTIPIPIGEHHSFAPIALGDVADVAAHVLSGKGQHGFDDRHRGQLMVLTGPMLCTGPELAQVASQSLGAEMEFENITAAEAKRVLKAQSESDQSEIEYILEYYSLVREGKTNYISTNAFHDVTGHHPTQPTEFFKLYASELRPAKRAKHSGNHH
ncbi:NAD(P)-binding protein [Xylariaceae sp. FL0255]|nr:NAD(P)-binding protein [Xylariaceae sp. FL0255]